MRARAAVAGAHCRTGKLVFKLKMTDLSVIPPNRRWRIIWNSQSAPDGQYYLGMSSDASGVVFFDYGTVATPVIGLVLGDPQTTTVGTPDAGSFTPAGLITFAIARNKVGNPQAGDLLGGISVRTFSDSTNKVRSTLAIDTTCVPES